MKRFEEQRRHQRRASTVEMNPEFEQKLGRFKPPAISDDDLKIMTIQRNAALLRARVQLIDPFGLPAPSSREADLRLLVSF